MNRPIVISLGVAAALVSVAVIGFVAGWHAPAVRHVVHVQPENRNTIVETYTPEVPTSTAVALSERPVQPALPENRHGVLRNVHEPIVKPGERWVRVPVLMYHYVRDAMPAYTRTGNLLSVSPAHFSKQMQEIVDAGFRSITPEDLASALEGRTQLPKKPILITFDDGYRDQYTDAFPVLKRLGIKATFFLISSYMASSTPAYMTETMVRDMDASGLATIGAHTRHHPDLAHLKPDVQRDEVVGSKQDLETVLHHPVTAFAYPYGSSNDDLKSMVDRAGFLSAFSTKLGSIHTTSTQFELRRVRVLDGEPLGPILERFGN